MHDSPQILQDAGDVLYIVHWILHKWQHNYINALYTCTIED